MSTDKLKEADHKPNAVSWPVAVTLTTVMCISVTLLSGCIAIHETFIDQPWTHLNPPRKNEFFSKTDKIIWCRSKTSAQAMSITGFFASGCYHSTLEANTYRVAELTRGTFGTTSVTFVRCSGPEGDIWIPLPSHGWA